MGTWGTDQGVGGVWVKARKQKLNWVIILSELQGSTKHTLHTHILTYTPLSVQLIHYKSLLYYWCPVMLTQTVNNCDTCNTKDTLNSPVYIKQLLKTKSCECVLQNTCIWILWYPYKHLNFSRTPYETKCLLAGWWRAESGKGEGKIEKIMESDKRKKLCNEKPSLFNKICSTSVRSPLSVQICICVCVYCLFPTISLSFLCSWPRRASTECWVLKMGQVVETKHYFYQKAISSAPYKTAMTQHFPNTLTFTYNSQKA